MDQQQQDLQQLQQDEEQQQLDQPPLSKWARCNGDEYASRNRYLNVDPYQANRVRLDVPDGCFDYINASPIALTTTKSNTTLTYIATQVRMLDVHHGTTHVLTWLTAGPQS